MNRKNPLKEYEAKRQFSKTEEPPPKTKTSQTGNLFLIQKHRASHLHYDFWLEMDGVLKSWAVPKGPSLDPSVRRLAMAVEDHPLDYADFEGIIPEGEYGGGTVMVWDRGTYVPETNMAAGLSKGELKFSLQGTKLKGSWVLVRTSNRQWLLIKHRDQYVTTEDITLAAPRSVVTQRTLAEIAEDEGGNVEKAATGDPSVLPAPVGRKRRRKKADPKSTGSMA
jgi:bifunctional non-homologous end joining protein LigD